ncbi:Uncharacterized conserved protein [Phaffia rhodozyma]|uniref:Uncharacterized conserved protein n=1 Tax=Phaffia rhodozyma TaxID=264483 RepID=A0A0F7SM22_PHARH|nr:Uncharacterized conserved protein [Phaffia rhodozyma]
MSSLQAFYPTKLSALSNQNRSSGFVPLEILLDSRLHNTDDFERVVSHTDAAIQYDKFNLLRLRNTTAKVLSKADLGAEHLQSHTDLVAVHVPRFGVIATPEQFASFYNVVNNLLLYQDPIQQAKNKKLQNFVYSFDHSNLSGTADVVQILQHRIRECQRMKADYQAHHDDTENSSFQAQLKAQAGQLAEELSLVFEAIAATQQVKDDQQRNNKSAVRFEATSTEIGWHLLSSEKNLLAKLTLKSPQYQNLSRVDGSTVNEFTVLDLQALNGHPEAVFPEALSRWFVDGKYHSVRMSPFIVAEWTILAPVGGISIVQHFGLRLHPVRLQIERKTGREMLNYFFQEKTHPKGYDNTTETEQPMAHSNPSMSSFASETSTDLAALNSHTAPRFSMHRTSPDGSSTVLSAPGENISSISLASSNTGVSHPRPFRSNSMASLTSQNESSSLASLSRADMPVSLTPSGSQKLSRPRSSQSLQKIATEREKHEQTQAEEMRVRASRNRTFIAIHIESTSFVLSYKGDKAKNITDLRDFRITSPALTFQNKTASFEDLVHEFKNQLIKAAWKQKGQLVQQIFTKTGNSARSPPSKGSTKKQSLKDKRSLPTRLSDNLGNGSFLDQPILRVSSPVSISSSSVESEPGQDQESPSSNSDSSSAYSGSGSVDHSGLGSGDSGGGNKTKAKFGGLLRQALHLPQDRKRVPNLNFASTTSFTSNVQGGSG